MDTTIRVEWINAEVGIVSAFNPDCECITPTSWAFMDYTLGYEQPHYPVPVTEFDNALAMPPERVTFSVKCLLLGTKDCNPTVCRISF